MLTVTVGFRPLFVFIDEVNGRHGQLSVVAFFVLPVWLASLVGSRLPEGYYRCHPFERRGRLYEMLGVRYFRMLVPDCALASTGSSGARSQAIRVVRDWLTLADYEARTRGAEAFHLGCLLVMAPAAVYATFAGWSGMALWLTLPSIPLHLYPVLLQRYTRARMAKALARM